MGPLVPGEHEASKAIKYGLVGVYTFPKVVAPLVTDSGLPPQPAALPFTGPSSSDRPASAAKALASPLVSHQKRGVGEGLQVVVEDTQDVGENSQAAVDVALDTAWDTQVKAASPSAPHPHLGSRPLLPLSLCALGHSLPSSPLLPSAGSVPALGFPDAGAPSDEELDDDHLSQLFPDEGLEDPNEGDMVLEAEGSSSAALDPPALDDAKEVDRQSEAHPAHWKDRPLPAVPMVEIPFFVPLIDKSMKQVLDGLMSVHTELKAFGLPLHRLHSDRGREFINTKVAAWTLHHSIQQTSTSGDDWKANGRTENWVRLLKRSTRTLLVAHGAPPAMWAFAMRHCAARLQAAALASLSVPQPRLLPWHSRLALRRRAWEHKPPWASRVTTAVVLCPSPFLRGGHLVRTQDGSFVHTEALVEVADTVELQEYVGLLPRVRMRGKRGRRCCRCRVHRACLMRPPCVRLAFAFASRRRFARFPCHCCCVAARGRHTCRVRGRVWFFFALPR